MPAPRFVVSAINRYSCLAWCAFERETSGSQASTLRLVPKNVPNSDLIRNFGFIHAQSSPLLERS